MSGVEAYPERLGGVTARERPVFGVRPAVRFAAAVTLTLTYLVFAVLVSQPWRSDLEAAIGPVASWVIPVMLAYIPALVIGFMCFTLLLTRYRPPPPSPGGRGPGGGWPPVTVVVAAYNEESAIEATLEHIAASAYPGLVAVVLADNNSSDRTAELGEAAALRLGLDYRRSSSRWPASITRSTRRSRT